ncbi:MAG TPA: hypothetical protein VK737_11010 [Opitutales bacterium]|nr:hypothetical protein [Opitutales bacterium]
MLTLGLICGVSSLARADDTAADQYEVTGNLVVNVSGVHLDGYANATSGYSMGAGLAVGGLVIAGYQLDASGNIINATGVNNGDDATFSNLTAGGLTLGNNLNIAGNLFIQNSINLGSWWDGYTTHSGVSFSFTDDDNETSSQVSFTGMAPQMNWLWTPTNGTVALDANGNLTLTDSTSGNSVALIPGNASVVLSRDATVVATIPLAELNPTSTVFGSNSTLILGNGSIVLNGASSNPSIQLGNYSLSLNNGGNALLLSENGSSNAVVLDTAGQAVEFGNGFSLGGNGSQTQIGVGNMGFAVGGNASANAPGAVALMGNANASGAGALAVSGGLGGGNDAIAMGSGSAAWGLDSVALAGGNATGGNALAIGLGITAPTWGTVVVGHYNQPISGSAAPAFVVGSGANSTATANALVIYNSGNMILSGNATMTDANHQLQVNGATTISGTANFNGNVWLGQVQGDVPMGPFGAH